VPGPSRRRHTYPVHCQTVRPCCATHCAHHPLYEKLPLHDRCYMDLGCQGKKIAPAANISSSKCYIRYVPGPTCRGSVPLYVPPLAIKGEACNVTKGGSFGPSLDRDSQLSSFHSNPTHSGVGYYALAARTTLNPRVFMCSVIA
jgi:hypothetical protein